MYLTTDQTEIGKINFLTALGTIRGDWLRKSLEHTDPGPYYFGYGTVDKPVKAGIVGTGDEGCQALIEQSSPAYLEYVAYHDIRPTSVNRGRRTFAGLYGEEQAKKIKFYEKWEEMLADKDLEAIVIATPLWTHHRFAIEAMQAGKHVLCEKLMSRYIKDGKAMVRTADETKKILSIGHQRHYSALYDNALAVIRSGVLGEIRFIRALWHRNNTWPRVGFRDPVDLSQPEQIHDGWYKEIRDIDRSGVDPKKYGYDSIEQLVRWRLYDKTGGGLMAELGSHQLDACSLFLGGVHPRKVTAIGGKHFYEDDRECEDHVYCTYEFPHPQDSNRTGVVVTYSSINTNSMEGYGEQVMGTKGSLLIMNERDVMLFKERTKGDPTPSEETHITVAKGDKGSSLKGTENLSLPTEAALAKVALEHGAFFTPVGKKESMVNRGYKNEIEAFAFAIRNPDFKIRCDGRVALADAVMALTANVAMRNRAPIDFKDAWYDPASEEAPDAEIAALANRS